MELSGGVYMRIPGASEGAKGKVFKKIFQATAKSRGNTA